MEVQFIEYLDRVKSSLNNLIRRYIAALVIFSLIFLVLIISEVNMAIVLVLFATIFFIIVPIITHLSLILVGNKKLMQSYQQERNDVLVRLDRQIFRIKRSPLFKLLYPKLKDKLLSHYKSAYELQQ